MKTTLLVAVSLCALAGCAGAPPSASVAPEQAASSAYPIEAPGEYSHVESGFKFAANIAGFERISLVRRDADARAITAGFAGGTPRCRIAITFWIDPVPTPPTPGIAAELLQMEDGKRLDTAFSQATRDVLDAYPGVELQSTQSGILDEMPARRASYVLDERRLELVVLVARHAWYIKNRVMFPASCAQEATPLIAQFFSDWRR